MNNLRKRFKFQTFNLTDNYHVIVVAVKLPDGAVETITNYDSISVKIKYYLDAYDDDFKLKANPEVQIVGYLLV